MSDITERLRVWTQIHLDAIAEIERLRAEVARLQVAVAFARSVIKSGELWTDECEKRIRVKADD